MQKRALITGITGQDGSFLAEHLIELGYEVWGVVRRAASAKPIQFIERITDTQANLRYGDMTDPASLTRILKECEPEEIYNLAAQSHVNISFKQPEYTNDVNSTGVVNILEAMRDVVPNARFYQASTSEMFGSTEPPQDEATLMHPRSPYGVAKMAAYWSVINSRESYRTFACNGILFNHESERRGENFVTRKITKAVARILLGTQKELHLGNLDSKRDWGYAKDYVRAMHLMLQHDVPDDYVVATGETHTVRDFLLAAFRCVDIEIESNGEAGLKEKYVRTDTGETVVAIEPRFYRPAEVDYLCGDAAKIQQRLGWEPEVNFQQLIELMVAHDLGQERSAENA
jgi:GDPmannose 4,6-dehydratase